jgi:uncharacterized protein involved in exopolysaccharide biosynthesis
MSRAYNTPPPYLPPPYQEEPSEVSRLLDYAGFILRAPLRHRVLAISIFLTCLALGVVALKVMPIRWEVRASILLQRSPLMGTLSNPGMNRDWDAPTRSTRELLTRRENLIAICKETNFASRYMATRAPIVRARDWVRTKLTGKERTPEEILDGLVDTLTDRLWVVVGMEGTVTVGFSWADKNIALDVVQSAIQRFMEERYATDIKMMGETVAILQGHDNDVQKDISEAMGRIEEKLRTLRGRAPARAAQPLPSAPQVVVAPRPAAADDSLARIDTALQARRRVLTDLEDARQRRLLELQAQLAQQSGVYAPGHPIIVGLQSAIESVARPSDQIEAIRAEVVDLERERTRRAATVAGTEAASATTTTISPSTSASSLAIDFSQLDRLRMESSDPRLEYEKQQLDMLLRQHSHLLERIDAARIEMDTAQAAFKYRYSVVSPPKLPRGPSKPYSLIFVGGGLMAGIALAFFLSALADLRGGVVVERWQIEQVAGLTVLTELRR